MDKEKFSKRLSELRNERNISARELSLSLGQNEGYINKIENQKNYPSMEVFFYFCEFMGVSPAQFFDENVTHSILRNYISSELDKMDEEKLNHVLNILRDINS